MQTLTVEILHRSALEALQDLQKKRFIKILSQHDIQSSFFPGEPFTIDEMKEWVEKREKGASMSLQTAKTHWTKKEKQFLA
jgi:hypothetical protein